MLFNSYEFFCLFFPLCLFAWWGLARFTNARLVMLVAASYLFYGWWNWSFTALLALSTILDWVVGSCIERSKDRYRRFAFLMISITVNLGILAYFKYAGFSASTVNDVLAALRSGTTIPIPQIILPVGISFYTFQTMTYSIDLYRGEVRSAKSLLHFAAYVSMFPQLIAGPIVRYSEVEDQLWKLPNRINWQMCASGIWFFVIGMSQKVLIADSLAKFGGPLLEDPTRLQLCSGWLALLNYACQLYFDFAGYSNMAVGIGLIMGLSFPQNFNSPYQATNIQDFWRRWHITLSSFLRDYLYIPLGGSRVGKHATYRNLLVVMLLGGLWHGAGWTFLIWGLWHGVLLVGYTIYRSQVQSRLPRIPAVLITFTCVLIGWLFFRSTDLTMAGHWFRAIVGWNGIEPTLGRELWFKPVTIVSIAATLFCWFAPNCWSWQPKLTWKTSFALAAILVACVLRFDAESPFLYFQF